MTEQLLGARQHKVAIRAFLKSRYGVENRTCGRVIALARARMIERVGRSKDELRGEALEYYESVLRNSQASIKEKLLAQRGIDKLLALWGASVVELTGAGGGAVKVEQPEKKQHSEEDGRQFVEDFAAFITGLRDQSVNHGAGATDKAGVGKQVDTH